MRHLPEAWLRTCRRVRARGDVAQAGAELLGRYAEPHRRYHDLTHLDEVLRHVDELAHHATDPDAVRLAAWYHDAVYEPAATDNEERSAQLASHALSSLQVDPTTVREVGRLVRLTATHAPEPGDDNGAVLCDADLAVLAEGPERYDAYVDAVRAEYGHVNDAAFARGRAEVLRGLLALDPMFHTADARSAWEPAARRNLAAELGRWETSGPTGR